MGAVGSERNLSFAAVGDTCNVASRMQIMCKELNADICVGAAGDRSGAAADDHEAIAGFINHGPVHVRGREGLVDVWYLPNPDNKQGVGSLDPGRPLICRPAPVRPFPHAGVRRRGKCAA